jgi:hypothetical protein
MEQKNKKVFPQLRKLTSPARIQDFIDTIPFNFEKSGETCRSPAQVLLKKCSHCLEGALLACTALTFLGERPLLMHLKVSRGDDSHAVALFKRNGYWGAISQTNHAVLGYRDPVYKTLRELALSYFHEYFLYSSGKKTLLAYSKPFSLKQYRNWMTRTDNLWDIADALARSPHLLLVSKEQRKTLRNAKAFERQVVNTTRWKHP